MKQSLPQLACTLNLYFFFLAQKEVPHFLRDAAEEPATEVTWPNTDKVGVVEKMILENEKKCLEKMKQDPAYNNSGTDTATHYATLV